MRLANEQPNIAVIYNDDNFPIGHFQFEDYGYNKSGVNLKWADAAYNRHFVHFVGATRESIANHWESLVKQHILGLTK